MWTTHACSVWLRQEGRTHKWLADQLGVHQSQLSHWMAGRREIALDTAKRIERLSAGKVKVSAWNCETTRSAQ